MGDSVKRRNSGGGRLKSSTHGGQGRNMTVMFVGKALGQSNSVIIIFPK